VALQKQLDAAFAQFARAQIEVKSVETSQHARCRSQCGAHKLPEVRTKAYHILALRSLSATRAKSLLSSVLEWRKLGGNRGGKDDTFVLPGESCHSFCAEISNRRTYT